MLNLVNQHSTTSKPVTTVPDMHNVNEFPLLPNILQRQQNHLHNEFFDELLNALTSKMEKIIEETTNRIFQALQQKIKKIEKTIITQDNKVDDATTVSDSDSNEESQVVKFIKNKQQQNARTLSQTTTSNDISAKPTTTLNEATTKPTRKQKVTKSTKRVRSPNSSMDASTFDNKDLKTNNKDD